MPTTKKKQEVNLNGDAIREAVRLSRHQVVKFRDCFCNHEIKKKKKIQCIQIIIHS